MLFFVATVCIAAVMYEYLYGANKKLLTYYLLNEILDAFCLTQLTDDAGIKTTIIKPNYLWYNPLQDTKSSPCMCFTFIK